mmetsp:Transcript_13604/g.36233  ORF Transcript_13604/g.36233 Transcript_13604/m.36233 type:complete len:207 (-) Transcript_13604:12-632(-)
MDRGPARSARWAAVGLGGRGPPVRGGAAVGRALLQEDRARRRRHGRLQRRRPRAPVPVAGCAVFSPGAPGAVLLLRVGPALLQGRVRRGAAGPRRRALPGGAQVAVEVRAQGPHVRAEGRPERVRRLRRRRAGRPGLTVAALWERRPVRLRRLGARRSGIHAERRSAGLDLALLQRAPHQRHRRGEFLQAAGPLRRVGSRAVRGGW